jgi:cytochrome c peroxidase
MLASLCANVGLLLSAAASAQTPVSDLRLGLPPPAAGAEVAQAGVAELGRRLFFDARLSADGKVSCGKCHVPEMAFSDGRARSLGRNDQRGTRNAPSLLNVTFATALFWDGRAADLESQALAPLTNPVEHALTSDAALVALIRMDSGMARDFGAAFAIPTDQIGAQHVGRALAAFERTLLAGGSPFDRYAYGGERTALTSAAIRGLELFQGRGGCATCHEIGKTSALLSDGGYHMTPMGLPPNVNTRLGTLTQKVVQAAARPDRRDLERLIALDPGVAELGRFVVTLIPNDIGKFKTPSLRNVALTAPYMHDGSVETLEQAIDLELYGRSATQSVPIALTLSERRDLAEFLRALSSPQARDPFEVRK